MERGRTSPLVVAVVLVPALAACGTSGAPLSKATGSSPTQTSGPSVAPDAAVEIPSNAGMVYVPAGEFLMGSDTDMAWTKRGRPTRSIWTPSGSIERR